LVEKIASPLEPALRATWLDQLRVEYKIKKNFVRDLPPELRRLVRTRLNVRCRALG